MGKERKRFESEDRARRRNGQVIPALNHAHNIGLALTTLWARTDGALIRIGAPAIAVIAFLLDVFMFILLSLGPLAL